MDIIIAIVIGYVFILTMFILFLMLTKNKKSKRVKFSLTNIKKRGLIKTSTYLRWYKRMSTMFIIQVPVRNLHKQIAALSILDALDAKVTTVKIYLISTFMQILVVGFSILVFKDIFLILIMLLYCEVVRETVINKQIDKMYTKMLHQFKDACQDVRQVYMQRRDILDTLSDIRYGQLVVRPMSEILGALTSLNVEQRLDDFYESSPLKMIQTLAGVCYATHDKGDDVTPSGISNFIEALGMIISEINLEIRRLAKQQQEFNTIDKVPIVSIFFIQPIKSFFIQQVPGLLPIYNGLFGYASTVIVLLISVVAFKAICAVNRPMAIRYDDRDQIDRKLLSDRRIRSFVRSLQPLKVKQRLKVRKQLQSAMSRLNLDHLYLRKFYMAVIGSVLALFVCMVSIYAAKDFLENSTASYSIMGGPNFTEEQNRQMREVDGWFLKEGHQVSEDEIVARMKNIDGLRLREQEYLEQIERLNRKKETLSKIKFSWVVVLLAIISGAGGSLVPNILVFIRKKLILNESKEDCLQLQTIIGIMMYTQLDTLELIDWLAKHSRVYKSVLIDSYHYYTRDAEIALDRLRNRANIPEFRYMVDKLKTTIQLVSIKEAFADNITERQHLMVLRENEQIESIKRKRMAMGIVAMIPIGLIIAFVFLAPILILAFSEFNEVLKNF